MKFYKLLAAVMFFCFIGAKAELVNLNPDPTGTPWVTGGYKYGAAEEAKYNSLPYVEITPEARTKVLDPMVDNTTGASGVYFRPVFHQGDYGNCAQAAAIGYAFTYEINRLRQLPANLEGNTKNQYPVNYTYNYWNNGESGTGSTFDNAETTGREYGIPNSEIWYEVTGDYLTGNAVQWMNGYEKYFDLFENRGAMQNRIKERIQFGDMTDPANIDKLKIYLDNHGYGSETGGVAVFGFDMEHADWDQIPPNYYMGNKSIFINTGIDFDHGMTIVGYDDNVAFDFEVEYPQPRQPFDPPLPPSNKYQNGSDKPMALWEVGALKIANSWGNGWPTSYDGGFIYLPYRLLAQGKVNGVCAIVPESDHEVQLAYKVNLFHELRNKMDYSAAMSINPASDPADSDVLEYQIITSQNKMGGLLPVQGVNSDPIEYGLDVTDFFKDAFKGTTDMYYPKKFFFIVDDISSAQPVIPNEILSFELYDHRNNNELHIRCNENNKVIAPDDRTSMSIIYDIFNNNEDFNNNEEVIHISDNVGFSLPAGISGRRTLSVANNSRLYFHNTSFDSRIPFGLPATDRPCIVIEGSAEFIGFDESTEDFINAEDTDFIINSILYLENCDLIMGESSVLVLNDNAEIIVTENSELVISPNSNITFGAGSNIVVKSGSTLKLSDDITIPVGSQIDLEPGANLVIDGNIRITGNIQMADGVNIDILDNSSLGLQLSQVTILAGTSLKLGVNAKLIIENGSNLIFEDGAVVELAEGAEIIIKNKGKLITNNNTTDRVTFASNTGSTGNWVGITCEGGSTLELNGVKISGATTAVFAMPNITVNGTGTLDFGDQTVA
ncbi:MAG: hypothetical protein L6407_04275, partial [Candidatus Delongbacteria bacterium]|nr:hypothetical protein [Candidatus Delongbacteria bacterium]